MEKELNSVEYESILSYIDESYADNNSDDQYTSTNALVNIWDGNYVHLILTQYMPDLKYLNVLGKRKVRRKEQNSSKKNGGSFTPGL